MSILQKPIARELAIKENKDGYWYYKICEGEKEIMESDLYQTSTECACAGMKFLDTLHTEAPLQSNYIPTAADFIYPVEGGKK